MSEVSVRYIVDDVDAAVDFYRERLGFEVRMRPGPGFAMLVRGGLRLLLNAARRWREALGSRCPTAASPRPAAGTASSSRPTTSTR